jgi:hypothetical protein
MKHAEVALGHHEYPGHVGIIDLDGVAIPKSGTNWRQGARK